MVLVAPRKGLMSSKIFFEKMCDEISFEDPCHYISIYSRTAGSENDKAMSTFHNNLQLEIEKKHISNDKDILFINN